MTYNLSNFTGANDFLSMSVASNQLVDGWLFTIIIILMYAIVFIGFKRFETKHALIGTGFIGFFFTAILWASGLVTDSALLATFVIMLFTLAIGLIMD